MQEEKAMNLQLISEEKAVCRLPETKYRLSAPSVL